MSKMKNLDENWLAGEILALQDKYKEAATHYIKNNLVDGSANEIAQRIMELSNNSSSLLQTGINANKLLNDKFSVEIMAKNYQDLYSKLIIGK